MNNVFTGKTVEEAITEALNSLGIDREQAEIEIIEEPSKGFLGIGAKPAKISVTKKKTDAMRVLDFLDGLFKVLGITASAEITEESEEKTVVNLITTDSSAVIGYRGEVLDSIQCIASAVFNSGKETYLRLVIDCEGYREKREETLKGLAKKLAAKAVKTGRKVTLEPMNPFERRIIHSSLMDFEGVKTVSEGKEPNRYVAIIPDGYDPSKQRIERHGGKHFNDHKGGGYNRHNDKGGHGERRTHDYHHGGKNSAKGQKTQFGGAVFLGNSLKDAPETNQTTDEE